MDSLNKVSHRALKDGVYAEFARLGQAVASPARIEMLELLAQKAWSVQELAQEMGLTVANASRHLRILHAARLVEAERHGTYVHYRVADGHVESFWLSMRRLGEARLAEIGAVVQRVLGDRDGLEPTSIQAFTDRVQRGDIVLLDVRPHDEYAHGHLPGARSVPLDELDDAMKALAGSNQPVVAYCRGPYCVWSDEAVERLREAGVQAERLPLGVADWRHADQPIEVDA